MNAVLIIDKPSGLTSHDVVHRVRRILRERSVGHLGTLDPMATGVLPLLIGTLTRLAPFFTASEKSYEGNVRFGFATDTYDADGEATAADQPINLSLQQVQEWASDFHGNIEQVPPPFSAKKIQGVPAYKLARKNQEVILKAVEVEIKEFTILSAEGCHVQFRARVSAGTYLRSIAHQLGQRAGCGAHLESLRRTASGEFDISQAHSLEALEAAAKSDRTEDIFIHPRRILPQLPCVTANEEMAARIRNGRSVNLPELSNAPRVKVFAGQRDLIAIATRVAGTLFHPKIVLAGDRVADAVH
jgi:tRNA pseudouridine55 synthase